MKDTLRHLNENNNDGAPPNHQCIYMLPLIEKNRIALSIDAIFALINMDSPLINGNIGYKKIITTDQWDFPFNLGFHFHHGTLLLFFL